MAELKNITPKHLLWVDLEMTGLDPAKDRIVEVAAIITDWDFNELVQFESGVGQDREEITKLFAANPWAAARPVNTNELIELSAKSPSEKEVEASLIGLVNDHFGPDEPAILAGNSIHQDRRFIQQWWPQLNMHLHYRMLDVSAWKVVMIGKYGLEFPKKESHRALEDIRESIDELKFYLKRFNADT
jgi:oligoribonuclease